MWLALGIFPDIDHEGRPFAEDYHPKRFAKRGQRLAGNHVGAFSEFRGDWKFQAEAFCYDQWYNKHKIEIVGCGNESIQHSIHDLSFFSMDIGKRNPFSTEI